MQLKQRIAPCLWFDSQAEQAAAFSGAANEDLAAERIADQEAELQRLLAQREDLTKSG